MKKLFKRMIPVALALAFCIGAVSMAACAQKTRYSRAAEI